MEFGEVEYAIKTFWRFLEMHPELCPHDFRWRRSGAPKEDGTRNATYECIICHKREIRVEKEKKY